MAAEPKSVTLCTLGPLTDIAMALAKAPAIAPRLREIVMMGGAYFEVGNRTPAAEFNILADPEAADAVMPSGVPLTMLPLDVTHQVLTEPGAAGGPRRLGNRAGKAVHGLLSYSEHYDLGKVRLGRRAAARPLRHRLPAEAGPVLRQDGQCRHRDDGYATPSA